MSDHDAGGALVQRVESRIWLGAIAANLGGAVIASLDGVVGSILYPGGISRARLLVLLSAGAAGVYILAVGFSRPIVRAVFRPAVGWLAEGRPPTPAEQRALFKQPVRQASLFLVFWAFVLAVLYPYARFIVHYKPQPMAFIKAYIFIALAGFFAWTICYLGVERTVRPLFTRSLAEGGDVPKRMGIFPRILLGWALVAGLPLASLAVELIGLDAHQLAQSIPVFYGIGATGVAIGIVASWIGAYALTDPIGKLTRALRAVAAGDLDTEVEVNEAGELGEVQMGFNQMVAGLREQQRIRDLFRRHVGDEVARHTIEAGGQIGGERREVSIVFVDIIGSTGLAQRHAPDDVVAILNRFFDVVVEAITFQEGIVSKFEGDGVLGVFGAVSDQPDHASRALRAARALRVELDALADAMGAEAAIGVASGFAVTGHLGASDRYEFTVVGEPVDEAIRLCDEAKLSTSRLQVSDTTSRRKRTEAEPQAVETGPVTEQPPVETTAALVPGRLSIRSLRSSIVRAQILASATGSMYIGAIAMFFHRVYPAGVSSLRFASVIAAGYAVFVLAVVPASFQTRRALRCVEDWLADDRAPTHAEAAELVRLPARLASVPFPYWVLTLLVVVFYELKVLHYHIGTLGYLKETSAFVLGALIGWTMCYLLVERTLRPVLTIAFASGDQLGTGTLRTFPRLLLAWLASSGAPMATLAFALTGLSAHQRGLVVPLLYVGGLVAAATGVLVVVVAARAVTDPMTDVRNGLRRIADGDFDVVVPVNDGGEIGLLEAEVNRMARGLRERERDLQLFGSQVGPEVASRALVEHALGGERRTVSAMFVRIVTSPLLSGTTSAEDVVGVFNALFDAIVRTVSAEGGSVNKIKSDGALCLFGAPVAVTDHAARALRTARALVREVAAHSLDIAIGVSTGDVVAGNVGAADRYEYTVIGDAVNEAARLTEHARQASAPVLVSESTVRASGAEGGGWTRTAELQLRGRDEPTVAFSPNTT